MLRPPDQVFLQHGLLADGTGSPLRPADILITGDRISRVAPPGSLAPTRAEVVDASGLVVAPGFIDVLSHSITSLLRDGRSVSKVAQGVTSEIMGEGWTPAPVGGEFADPLAGSDLDQNLYWRERARSWFRFGDWLAAQQQVGCAVNFGSFLGSGTVRQAVRGFDPGPSSPAQLQQMQKLTREAMQDGAFGLSAALIYPPDSFADTAELTALCREVAAFGGIYITHLRSEGAGILEALDEAFTISEQSGARLHIYHLKLAGREHWSKLDEVLRLINTRRAQGSDIHADMYLYTAAGTALMALLPPWASAGNRLRERLRDPSERARIREAVRHPDGTWEPFGSMSGPEHVVPLGLKAPGAKPYNGQSLAQIAAQRGQHWIDAALDLIEGEEQSALTAYHMMSEANIEKQLREPWIMLGSDAQGYDPADPPRDPASFHPRACGNFARLLSHYVRDRQVLPLEEAIRRMTSLPAQHLRLAGRGEISEGALADVVLFDPAAIQDQATFTHPSQLATGVRDVWVNGVRVWRDGQSTGALPGRRLQPHNSS